MSVRQDDHDPTVSINDDLDPAVPVHNDPDDDVLTELPASSDEEGCDDVDIPKRLKKMFKCVRKCVAPVTDQLDQREKSSEQSQPTGRQDNGDNEDVRLDSSSLEDFRYKFNHPLRGLALIINLDAGDRTGSKADVRMMEQAMQRHGFETRVVNRYLDFKHMMMTLREAAKWEDHSRSDCFVCCVTSHGYETLFTNKEGIKCRKDVIECKNDTILEYDTILECFNEENCPGLKGKPKMFFFQACRGDNIDQGHQLPVRTDGKSKIKPSQSSSVDGVEYNNSTGSTNPDVDSIDANPNKGKEKITPVSYSPIYEDCLALYATPPGYFAIRRGTGSWMITELYNVLMSNEATDTSLTRLLTRVLNKVALSKVYEMRSSDPRLKGAKAMPVLETMLLKEVVFSKKIVE